MNEIILTKTKNGMAVLIGIIALYVLSFIGVFYGANSHNPIIILISILFIFVT